ncbi:MAG TPA: PPK2 family polyphosphate kinase [Candidatus Dormibacteraeota bacterium]|nr:PPK2 family polyphosphate kinase [Candidatus Dormibacteraeota bacterium]HEX2681888.1 PPK2 family polyphosphate kinase [Candidatus Dormibacteraeota bacterium]
MAGKNVRSLLRAQVHDGRFRMVDVDPDSMPGFKGGHHLAERQMVAQQDVLFELHERLFAERKRALLVVLQGMDTSGKDGTVTHVVRNFNPQGVLISGFKAPTPEEKRHGFLWRIRKRVPVAGDIGIFNRSHYEDVLIARVHNLAPPAVIERRYGQINQFEKELVKSGTLIVKICLHISYAEQRKRLIARLDDANKRWKFSEHDIDERAYWDDYMSAYGLAVTRCSTDWAPWYVVPANDKVYRNWAVTMLLAETLQEMNPQYPQPKLDIPRLMKRLRA